MQPYNLLKVTMLALVHVEKYGQPLGANELDPVHSNGKKCSHPLHRSGCCFSQETRDPIR